MAEIGYGYGSEWHLMRFMARHRKCLERAICEKLDDEESKFVWLDFDFNSIEQAEAFVEVMWKASNSQYYEPWA